MSIAKRNPLLAEKIKQMRLNIAPIVHIYTGQCPPEFPSTLLELFLLTEDELDSMAHFYAQIYPDETTNLYPQVMDFNQPYLSRPTEGDDLPDSCRMTSYERLRVKMRIFARFIGMRGAETPRWEYERQMDIIVARIEHEVQEEQRAMSTKSYRGLTMYP
ncbi:hypothetical protein BU24DRAFT_232056 [Aaosphaeria arxii CBS 175.79]|uniref:Uncharacterized protein n=1 Tax=Aaosphaeria arxii CBS 175.79 TaxID=1450172 RepID=A0A6A5XJS5_9PLEO|nr:uncharacterized protein BU24DRAFT_232056 [Aaosphaeria arxii CBS 175.79]KAF2013203.1 hypothetical protein BU24DRAFT_232056 [Aaosphaeria arxii CBS 175.79]